ncbi:6-phosphogluconolactonase [Bacteroides helcogenes]|uniref:6-phosphogluconolactonase n=1 Tax=Bacteroides helcogenes (strain ATCC 35417 / DSM 20613 / JCM 6297 / CCUG 15421 / P 36-108) TaxID=693979 RepID=E6SWX5_BACT6|nr:6-phosphogluconolactonase [Bacteroides helcogenes]ADV44663.1 6-phosphogluconolactonase [Bacteroides helcogenes P 36-108]MDY5238956.1 6-phosphogluconolactonase [Bacteroides helcogenes]
MKSYIYSTATETAHALVKHLIGMMGREPEKIFYFAFSGGSTPSLMFDIWANEYKHVTPWERMRVYWVDERCVPMEDSESNYGTMRRLLLDEVGMPDEFVFPIFGNHPPEAEAKRYSAQVCRTVPLKNGFPTFDAVMLGAGDDGHTSSIFPGQEYLLSSFHPYEVSVNPYNGQQRIAMTGCLLFAARKLIFFITGKNKAGVVRDILASGDTGPAAYVAHHAVDVEIFIDVQAEKADTDI